MSWSSRIGFVPTEMSVCHTKCVAHHLTLSETKPLSLCKSDLKKKEQKQKQNKKNPVFYGNIPYSA